MQDGVCDCYQWLIVKAVHSKYIHIYIDIYVYFIVSAILPFSVITAVDPTYGVMQSTAQDQRRQRNKLNKN